jgi:hypothetical protein
VLYHRGSTVPSGNFQDFVRLSTRYLRSPLRCARIRVGFRSANFDIESNGSPALALTLTPIARLIRQAVVSHCRKDNGSRFEPGGIAEMFEVRQQ